MTDKNKSVYIPQIEGKDLWLGNYSKNGYDKKGYSILNKSNAINVNKFKAAFDYSLDLLKIRELCTDNNMDDFEFSVDNKLFSKYIINVTFEYSVKTYNKISKDVYVKSGYNIRELNIETGAHLLIDNTVVAIKINNIMDELHTTDSIFNKFFYYENGKYCAKKSMKTICSVDDIRKKLYEDGFCCDGIKYVRWKRSSGSARVGKCLFIEERLKGLIKDWENCDLDVKLDDEIDLAAFESYVSLTSSSIIDTMQISANNILIIDDYESVFNDDVITVGEDNKRLVVTDGTNTIVNNIWDGQSIIDVSILEKKYKDKGMVLLRNRFFKSCCFNGEVQKWFADNNIIDIKQLNGFTLANDIKDIKLITTPSSIKYLKFGSLESWLSIMDERFGLVKYEKPTHFMDGKLVQTHYQLINSIQITKQEMKKLLEPTFNFVTLIRKYPEVLKHWIKYNDKGEDFGSLKSKTDIVYKMMSINNEFCNTKLYYDFRNDFLKSFFKSLKCGHILVEGNYSTLCGNPIEMLKASIGFFDGTTMFEKNTIHNVRFKDGCELLGSRSPHISFSNVLIRNNKHYELINEYMNTTDEIVYINSIDENILEQLSGCDFDSDGILLTDNKILLKASKRNNGIFKIAINKVEGSKTTRRYNPMHLSDLDIKTSKNLIGEIINLSQELNTLIWDLLFKGHSVCEEEIKEIYYDVCKLSIMSGLEIDSAKKEFNVDNSIELKDLRNKYNIKDENGRLIKPNFFAHIAKQKGYYEPKKKNYKKQETSMDYLQNAVNSFNRSKKNKAYKINYIQFSDVINKSNFNQNNVDHEIIHQVINGIDMCNNQISYMFKDKNNKKLADSEYESYLSIKQDRINKIEKVSYNSDTMIMLLEEIEKEENKKYKRLIFYTLFGCANEKFYEVINHSRNNMYKLYLNKDGDIDVFGDKFINSKISTNA